MNDTLMKALIALVPILMLLAGSARMLSRRKTISCFLQLVGASGLVVVVLTHVCEALHLLTWMQWGVENSAGHYLDLAGALVGMTLFPIGYLAFAVSKQAS